MTASVVICCLTRHLGALSAGSMVRRSRTKAKSPALTELSQLVARVMRMSAAVVATPA